MNDPVSVIKKFVDEYQTKGDESVAESLLADDFVDHTPFPGFGQTRDDVQRLFRVPRVAFPDLRAEVMVQFTGGRTVAIRVMDFVRVEDERMKEYWNVVDVPGMMAQLTRSA